MCVVALPHGPWGLLAHSRRTPRPSPRTNRTRRVPHPVLIGHAGAARAARRLRVRFVKRLSGARRAGSGTAGGLRGPFSRSLAAARAPEEVRCAQSLHPKATLRRARQRPGVSHGESKWLQRLAERNGPQSRAAQTPPGPRSRSPPGGSLLSLSGARGAAALKGFKLEAPEGLQAALKGFKLLSSFGTPKPHAEGPGAAPAPQPLGAALVDLDTQAQPPPPPPPPCSRTRWTRRVPHPVLIGHAASLTRY